MAQPFAAFGLGAQELIVLLVILVLLLVFVFRPPLVLVVLLIALLLAALFLFVSRGSSKKSSLSEQPVSLEGPGGLGQAYSNQARKFLVSPPAGCYDGRRGQWPNTPE